MSNIHQAQEVPKIVLHWTDPWSGLFSSEECDDAQDAMQRRRYYERDGCSVLIEGLPESMGELA